MGKKKNYYITTAIVYASRKPHIGNDYEIILADSLARFKRLDGYRVRFQTGTDEHGLKIQNNALAAGLDPQTYVDELAKYIKETYDQLNISYDHFIRTTDESHVAAVGAIFSKLLKNNDIYLSKYDGWYSIREEAFIKEEDLIDGKTKEGEIPIWMSEESYFLNVKKYQARLLEYIKKHEDFIEPEVRKNEMINSFFNKPISDLSITRTKLNWGVKLPFDEKHTSYVWIDALSNYITGLGYHPQKPHQALMRDFWPANIQVIGKDILRFHTIYWPILLLALGLELPKKIFGHPWILMNNDKMSKSWGNVLYSRDLIKYFGVDSVRYYCLHEVPFKDDGNIGYELLMQRVNSDLTNTVGNLLNRTLGMIAKYQGGVVKKSNIKDPFTTLFNIKKECSNLLPTMRTFIDKADVAGSLECIIELARKGNKYIDLSAPWELFKKGNKKGLINHILNILTEVLRYVVVALQPFIPTSAAAMAQQLKLTKFDFASLKRFYSYDTKTFELGSPVFVRFEIKEVLKEIEVPLE
ncbi:MAG: methionine--tRNA ligase [Acholeplasmatales bacterium]|jgi:methionyl-tRNA synthetase|nr:methionine--tRNA ligase [Acholeplasmatales bacterium]